MANPIFQHALVHRELELCAPDVLGHIRKSSIDEISLWNLICRKRSLFTERSDYVYFRIRLLRLTLKILYSLTSKNGQSEYKQPES